MKQLLIAFHGLWGTKFLSEIKFYNDYSKWNEELERYDIEISFESEVLKQAAMRAYTPTETTTSKSNSDSDDDSADDAEIEEKKAPVKKKTGILKKRTK